MLFHDHSVGNIDQWEWTFEGGIPNHSFEQNPVIFFPNAGEFDVTLKISNNDEESEITKEQVVIIHNCAGIENSKKEENIEINNPVSDFLNIQLKNSKDQSYKIEIFNSTGRKIYTDQKSSLKPLNLSSLSSGYYILKIQTEHQQYSKSFIKI